MNRDLSIHFTESPQEEIVLLSRELQLYQVAEGLLNHREGPLSDDVRSAVVQMIATIGDMFSSELPDIDPDPEITLRMVSRDINTARILRERGIFRFYRLTRALDRGGAPTYLSLNNPITGSPFAKQEEFISWFCSEARVSRAMVFMRFSTIERMESLGFDLPTIYSMVGQRPFAIQDTLKSLASWSRDQITGVDGDILVQVAERVLPEQAAELEALVEAARDNPELAAELHDAARPVIAAVLDQVAKQGSSKDALDFLHHDLLGRPAIEYNLDAESGVLTVSYIPKRRDEQGNEYELPAQHIPFIPDRKEVPDAVLADLARRLPLRNKHLLDVV